MIHPFNLPMVPALTDAALITFCEVNPDLFVERDEKGQLFIKTSRTFALNSCNKSEVIGELGLWNRRFKAGKVLEVHAGYFLPDSSMRVPDVAWIGLDSWNSL